MLDSHGLERIIVVPRNGYANRLQAWASSAILAAELDVPVKVLWEPEPVAPATAEQLFSPTLLRTSFVESSEVTAEIGRAHAEWPRHLTVERDVVVLAGHDLGEQHFMPALLGLLVREPLPRLLVIIAGGKFHLPNATSFELQRKVFYSRIDWSEAIASRVTNATSGRAPFLGLHIRQTDRSTTAPSASAIQDAVQTLSDRTGIASVFVAADTAAARDDWHDRLHTMALEPWSVDDIDHERGNEQAGIDAIVDWRVLGRAVAVAYSAESSFGQEAAVAGGNEPTSIGLSASPARQRLRELGSLARSALTYPRRRLRASV